MNEEAVREKLVDSLAGLVAQAGNGFSTGELGATAALYYADALLPVVREIAAEEAREALNDAAYAIGREAGYCYGAQGGIKANTFQDAAQLVRNRADALTKPPDGPVR